MQYRHDEGKSIANALRRLAYRGHTVRSSNSQPYDLVHVTNELSNMPMEVREDLHHGELTREQYKLALYKVLHTGVVRITPSGRWGRISSSELACWSEI